MSTTTARESRPQIKRRRFSTTDAGRRRNAGSQLTCQRLPQSIDALDLSSASAKQTLASLRFLILSYLADLENHLSQLESPRVSDLDFGIAEMLRSKGELTVEEARIWAKVALEMMDKIRADVRSHLPEFHFTDISVPVEDFVKSHLPEFPDVSTFNEMRFRLPDFGLAEMSARLDEVRARFADLDFKPLNYIPTLSDHLESLHAHLYSFDIPCKVPSLPSNSKLSDFFESILSSDIVAEFKEDVDEAEEMFERATADIKNAIKRSFEGSQLIRWDDLPQKWRNNRHVTRGYRFIPLERWPLIIMSLFAIHNETINIHTHLIPFLTWSLTLIPCINPKIAQADAPEIAFLSFALVCLASSALWHTMAGCAHPKGMEICARVDYVGIGWLISASVGTIVYYGFQCEPHIGQFFLACCLLTGMAGNVFPFMDWFNQRQYKNWRIVFFLSMAFTAVAPMLVLAYIHTLSEMFDFVRPLWPSLISYLVGLAFYATHVPERWISDTGRLSHYLDYVGGGSHAIWHAFIVLAISQHKAAMAHMRNGVSCAAHV